MTSLYDNSKREMTVQKGCPWYEAQQEYGAPNVNWCEPTRCSIVNEPANTWSNLGFILFGFLLIKKLNEFKEKTLAHFGWAVIWMGILSLTYHASNNYLMQFLDFVGMYLMTSFVIAFNIQRVMGKDPRKLYSVYWFLVAVNCSMFMVFDITDIPVQKTVMGNVIPLVILDLIAAKKEGSFKLYKFFGLGIVFLVVAQVFSQLDLKRVWCEPDNIFLHGHAIWHVLASIGMLFTGFHISTILKNKYPNK
jgi:hypothetical protein